MSYDLCLTKKASEPYFIEIIHTNIYTLEELCYFLSRNVCLIDQSIMNEKLCVWIRDELGLVRLYRTLHEQLEQQGGLALFLLPILREIQYLSAEDMRKFQDELTRLDSQPEDIRRKMRADFMGESGMYGRAVREYGRILNHRSLGKFGAQFYAEIWNNMGAAHAGLFHFKEAADCFRNAWKLANSREYLKKYVSALPLFMTEEEYREELKSLNLDPVMLAKIQEHNARLCLESNAAEDAERALADDPEKTVRVLREEYYRSVML